MLVKGKLCLLIVLLLSILLTGCGEKDKIACETTIKKFEKSWEKRDVNGVLDCIDPKISGIVQIGTMILGDSSGIAADQVFKNITSYLNINFGEDSLQAIKELNFKIDKVIINGTSASAKGKANFKSYDIEVTKEVSFSLIKVSDQWYINGFKILS
ncbi:MAG: hypothetical protein ACRCU3_09085 [Eubacteriaceae bacterium]